MHRTILNENTRKILLLNFHKNTLTHTHTDIHINTCICYLKWKVHTNFGKFLMKMRFISKWNYLLEKIIFHIICIKNYYSLSFILNCTIFNKLLLIEKYFFLIQRLFKVFKNKNNWKLICICIKTRASSLLLKIC